jgi:hypothetical protein
MKSRIRRLFYLILLGFLGEDFMLALEAMPLS